MTILVAITADVAAIHNRLVGSIPAPPSTGSAGGLGGWLGGYLRDPAGAVRHLLMYLRDWAITWVPVAGPILIGVLAGVWVVRRWWRRHQYDRMVADARVVTVLAPPIVDAAGGEALWANLIGLLRPAWKRLLAGQPHLAVEYVFSEHGVTIRLWVPGVVVPGLVERAIESAWPGAHTHTDPATPPLPEPGVGQRRIATGGELRLARPDALPIRTAFDTDPLRALLGAPAGLGRGEHACVQILTRPATGHRLARTRRAGRGLHTGSSSRPVSRLLDLLTPGVTPASGRASGGGRSVRHRDDPQTVLEFAAQDRAMVTKQRGNPYDTVIRYAVATTLSTTATPATVRVARDRIRGRAHALAASFARYTEHNHYRRRPLRHAPAVLAERRLGCGDLLSVPELAALAHLPTDAAIPGVQRAGAQAIAPPPGVATPGPDAKPLGVTDTGVTRPVALRVPDARHHLHVLGATGSGKSTLLAQLILADIAQRRGVVVIDPKGDLVTDVLARLPVAAASRVVLFDADSRATPPCLNPLDGGGQSDTDMTVDNLVSIFRRVYSAYWGPRTDDVMRAACLTLRAQSGVASLADLPRLLAEPAFRTRLVREVTDRVLKGFWDSYEELTDAQRSQVISPLMNKLRAFLLRPFVRDALAAGPSTVNLSTVLDGGILLCRIPKGSLGEETTRLIGSLVVARAWQATTARARIPQRLRRDASLIVDECHNFLNIPYPLEDMLAEARGFRVSMVLAHQHLGQLPRELKEGISTNARSKVFFTASPEDARELARHTAPRLTDHDLAHLGVYHAAARLVLHGQEAEPFTLLTQPLRRPVPGRARQIRRLAHQAAAGRAGTPAATPPTSAPPAARPARPRTASSTRPGPGPTGPAPTPSRAVASTSPAPRASRDPRRTS